MRYHSEKPEKEDFEERPIFVCDHLVYTKGSLYKTGKKGLVVIQQRYDPIKKSTSWGPVDSWVYDLIFSNKNFRKYFNERAKELSEGFYPTVTVRQIMHALRIKPLPKQPWETYFDRKEI